MAKICYQPDSAGYILFTLVSTLIPRDLLPAYRELFGLFSSLILARCRAQADSTCTLNDLVYFCEAIASTIYYWQVFENMLKSQTC